ncbi:MAG: LysM peptidoglycan-binding domain-containing protein [Pseudonocardiaceae bacterium]
MTAPQQVSSPPAPRTRPRPVGLGPASGAVRVVEVAPCPASGPPHRAAGVLAAAVVTFAVVCGLAVLGGYGPNAPDVPGETSVVRVGAGETVWDVAERVAPRSDPRAVVQRIRELNGMAGSAVEAGGQLRVPDGR